MGGEGHVNFLNWRAIRDQMYRIRTHAHGGRVALVDAVLGEVGVDLGRIVGGKGLPPEAWHGNGVLYALPETVGACCLVKGSGD